MWRDKSARNNLNTSLLGADCAWAGAWLDELPPGALCGWPTCPACIALTDAAKSSAHIKRVQKKAEMQYMLRPKDPFPVLMFLYFSYVEWNMNFSATDFYSANDKRTSFTKTFETILSHFFRMSKYRHFQSFWTQRLSSVVIWWGQEKCCKNSFSSSDTDLRHSSMATKSLECCHELS